MLLAVTLILKLVNKYKQCNNYLFFLFRCHNEHFLYSFPEIHNVKSGMYITKYINPLVYVPNLTSVKDNLKIYNYLLFFRTLLK
jgi:hypothetical protein